MGIPQFMPSNILTFAKDGNNDGRVDLFNHADSIMSVATYLKHYGWHNGLNKKETQKVIYQYNHSSQYVDAVLKVAELLKT
jgi:membrane-bound lytic murein transglycosylase B